MCLPAVAMTAISTGFQVLGQVSQARYNSAVERNNAINAKYKEQIADEQGAEELSKHRAKVRQFAGEQISQMAASGAAVSSADSLALLADTAILGEIDEQTIKRNTDLEKWGYRNEARAATAAAKQEKTSGYFDAFGTALGGASKYMKFKRYGTT